MNAGIFYAIAMPEFFVKGGPVMWPLLACSLAALTVIIERTVFYLVESARRDRTRADAVLAAVGRDDVEGAIARTAGSRDFVVRMLWYGLLHRDESVGDSLQLAAAAELKRMRRFLPVLDTIITLAPMLGILGTVTGIIKSFGILGLARVQDPHAVIAGIAEALITTVAGLVISIGALVPYNFFGTRLDDAAEEMSRRGTQLEILLGASNRIRALPRRAVLASRSRSEEE